nr:penicillin-binding protein 2 [bacterium]
MEFEHSGNRTFQRLIITAMTVASVVMGLRLAQFSVIESTDWSLRARDRILRTLEIEPRRGRIIAADRRTVLADSEITLSIAVDNCAIGSTGKECVIANRLAEILGVPPEVVISRIHSRHNAEWVARDIDRQVFKRFLKAQLDGLLPGVSIKREVRRIYPEHPVAASLLGFVTREREPGFDTLGPYRHVHGVEGIEVAYEDDLRGQFGACQYRINRFYAPEHDSFETLTEVRNGNDLVTTIDPKMARLVREELIKALKLNAADSAMAIVMDPDTGAILASDSVENTPEHLDPEYRSTVPVNCWPPEARRNLVHTAVFEPGSIWKPVIMSIALENGIVHPGEIIPWKPAVVMGGHAFRDWKDFNRDLQLKEVLIWSSNVGIIEVSRRMFQSLPDTQIYEQIQGMGFLRNLPVDYPVRPRGTLNPGNWSAITVGAVAEGYETGVTMSQLGAFYCAVANGGRIVYPHYGRHLLDADTGEIIRDLTPEPGYPVMSPETAEFIRNAMTECVDYGTGKKGSLEDYHVSAAGKTATAK